MKAALVIMAAGMGSRYGGNKQVVAAEVMVIPRSCS